MVAFDLIVEGLLVTKGIIYKCGWKWGGEWAGKGHGWLRKQQAQVAGGT